jgi:putative two-component system response regulator
MADMFEQNLPDSTVLIADDVPKNVQILGQILEKEGYDVAVAQNGREVLEVLQRISPDLILLDIMMPEMDGLETSEKLRQQENTRNIPIIFITAKGDKDDIVQGFNYGAVDYIVKPFEASEVKARVRTHLQLKKAKDYLANQNEILDQKVKEKTQEIQQIQKATMQSLSSLVEYRDPETGGHILRTQEYVRLLGEKALAKGVYAQELTQDKLKVLVDVTPLHDIGKVSVPDHILLKPGKLNDEEYEEMKRHVIYGEQAMVKARRFYDDGIFFQAAADVISGHHEKWDGSGYPYGKKETETPIGGRLMAVADVYDALISRRVYKDPMPHYKAVAIIKEGRAGHFDPLLVDLFMEMQEQFRQTGIRLADFAEEKQNLLDTPYSSDG